MKRLAIIGSGDFAQSLCEEILRYHLFDVVGFFDNSFEPGAEVCGLPVIGCDQDIIQMYENGIFDVVFIAIGYTKFDVRERIFNELKGVIPFATVIFPTAYVHPSASIGEGVLLSEGVFIHKDAIVADNVAITLRSIVNHGCRVGKHTFFSTGVVTAGNVVIGERCFLGVGTVVSSGVSICDDVWLSPGVVVLKSINSKGKYLSVASKVVCIG